MNANDRSLDAAQQTQKELLQKLDTAQTALLRKDDALELLREELAQERVRGQELQSGLGTVPGGGAKPTARRSRGSARGSLRGSWRGSVDGGEGAGWEGMCVEDEVVRLREEVSLSLSLSLSLFLCE